MEKLSHLSSGRTKLPLPIPPAPPRPGSKKWHTENTEKLLKDNGYDVVQVKQTLNYYAYRVLIV